MNIIIIITLIVAAILLFLAELFLIPGLSIAGIASLGCLIYANVYAFMNLGTLGGIITLIVSIATSIICLIWFMKSKTLDKLSLKKQINSSVTKNNKDIKVGDEGIAVTRLAQIGSAEFNGRVIEVKSIDGFINEKTPIVVRRIEDKMILVEKINN